MRISTQRLVILAGLLFSTIVVVSQSILDARNMTELLLLSKADQIELAITNQDQLKVRKILQEGSRFGAKNISMSSARMGLITAYPSAESPLCIYNFNFQKHLLVGETVQFEICVDFQTGVIIPARKTLFWVFILMSFLILYSFAAIPLFAFKENTKRILKLDEGALPELRNHYTDDLQLELIERLEMHYREKIQNELIKIEKNNAEFFARIAAAVAHDLKSPMSVLNTIAHRLKSENLNSEFDLLSLANSRMQEILASFQTEAKSFLWKSKSPETSGTANSEIYRMNIREVFDGMVKQKTAEWDAHARITYQVICNLGERQFPFPKSTFERHLSNLLNNSIQSMIDSGEIILSATEVDSKIRFEVTDNGTGMDESKLKLLGQQVHTESKNGMGFGFYSFKCFVEGQSGEISVTSQLGRGTSVVFDLPYMNQ